MPQYFSMTINLRALLTTMLLSFSLLCFSQQITLTGQVVDKANNEPLPNVLVTIRPVNENKIIRHAQTSLEGKFEIKIPSIPKDHVLYFSMIGYAPYIVNLSDDNLSYNISLTEKATVLKEVTIKAPSIRQKGDTITYMVSSFSAAQDRSLADVLKKMPGIEVEKTGEIKYNGVAINKFYIEGRDLLGGRYELATNNLHQQDVGSVEVMENHQPIKALEDISFSQNPAINIRLKEDAKARWVGTAKLGAGADPFIWSTELFVMRFTSKNQTLNTYKSNNTGIDVTQETQSFSIDDMMNQFSKKYKLENYINIKPEKLTDIDSERVRFNTSHIISTNNLWAISKNYDLTSQISYTKNKLDSDNFSQTVYYLKDSTIITDIRESANSKDNRLSVDLALTANTPTSYFNNKLSADLLWNDIDMNIAGDFPNFQSASIPHRQFSNDLEILKRIGNKTYTLNSFNQFQIKPQHLSIERKNEIQNQDVRSTAFYTNTNTSVSFFVKPVTISMKIGIIGLIRSMDSEAKGISDTLDVLNNDLTMRYLNLYATPEIEYNYKGFEARLDMPISLAPYSHHNKISDDKESTTKFQLSPRLYFRYHFSSRLLASVSGRLSQSPVEEQYFYDGLILQNYRNLSSGYISYQTGNQKSLNLSVSYKKPLNAFFANANVFRSWNKTRRSTDRSFLDEYIVHTFIPQNNNSNVWMLSGNTSKGIEFINGMISLRTSYMTVSSSIFQNEVKTPYTSNIWSISSKINSKIATWCNISYEFEITDNKIKIKETQIDSSTESIAQKMFFNLTPSKKWYLQLVGEHYCNKISDNISKNLFLTDAQFTYSVGNGWEFNLSVKNIFNQNRYRYTMYDSLTSISKEYKIRPRNIMTSVFFRF